LLSRAALQVVRGAGFEFYELFGGIQHRGRRLVPRVIGWGSLSGVEARATALYADLQSRLPARDLRIAVHPADMRRPSQRRAITRVLKRVLAQARPLSYDDYLGAV
jgi:hypothetical protein